MYTVFFLECLYLDVDIKTLYSPISFTNIRCSMFPFLGLVVKLIKQDNFDAGQRSSKYWFDAPKFDAYVKKMTISFKWKDQGYGNRLGRIWLQIIRGKKMIFQTSKDLCGLAPHKWGNVNKDLTRSDTVISNFRPGDHFRFMRHIGGGGGHSLHVRNFKALVELQDHL